MENLEELKKLALETGVIPIDIPKENLHTIIMDINGLPSEYKNLDVNEAVRRYQLDFKVKIIPVDFSRQNMQGNQQYIIVIK